MSSSGNIKINSSRGRPKKYKTNDNENDFIKKGRGRPRKLTEDNTALNISNNTSSPNFIKLKNKGEGFINPLNGDPY